ncbi:Arylsulfatase B like protein [Argiope bruennichi]|uniref:Arylsulfatase B like protein n=1 Tax=Argiope bruennichi TaxID=94029 RepID=A0A8T0F091_ARGBR|nr:Arylsulfatase B like protein [Argiope bruennichi]
MRAITLFAIYLLSVEAISAVKVQKPHIVFMIVDDLGWNDVSFHGSKQIPTPNIDAIARDGIILNNYYVAPTCSPSRGSLMTGKYPLRLGFQHEVIIANSPWGLPLEEKILPQYMKSLNYVTRGVGKWHLGFFKEDYLPMKRGFDSFFGYWNGVEDYFTHFSDVRNMSGLDLHDNYENCWEYNGTYGTELFTLKAKEVILKHNPAKPLFLYIGQQAPHSGNFAKPLQVPEKYVKPLIGIPDKNRRTFAGMVSALDHSVGEIFEALEKAKMLDNTIFVFTTDNGGAVEGTDGSLGSNYPLRGSKYNLWEGGIRATCFVWSPFLRHRSRIFNELMHISDWLPTLISAAEGPEMAGTLKNIDGVDLWPSFVHNLPSPRQEILLNIDSIEAVEGIRWKNFKLVKGSYYEGRFDGWYDKNGKLIKGLLPAEPKTRLGLYKKTYLKYLKRSKAARILWRKYAKDPRIAMSCPTAGCKTFPIVKCAQIIPPSESTCKPKEASCLFDIEDDPCEHYNLAEQYPEVTEQLEASIDKYRHLAKSPGAKPPELDADPKLHGNAWMPWK